MRPRADFRGAKADGDIGCDLRNHGRKVWWRYGRTERGAFICNDDCSLCADGNFLFPVQKEI